MPNPRTPGVAPLIVPLVRAAVHFSSRVGSGCVVRRWLWQFLQCYWLGLRTFLGFSCSVLLLAVKQSSCLEENGRGLLHILTWSNPSLIPRGVQSFCTGNRETMCICNSRAGGPRVSLCSLTLGTAQYVILAHLSLLCISRFGPTSGSLPFRQAFLAWLPGTDAVAQKSSNAVSRSNLEVHTLLYLLF